MKIPKKTIDSLLRQHNTQPKDYDLCVKFKGCYIDVMLRYDNTWRLKVANIEIGDGFETRLAAIQKLEKSEFKQSFQLMY